MESRALVRIARLTREKLASMRRVGATRICHLGGLNPPEAVPFSLNQEIFRLFQFGLAADFDQALHDIAARQVGAEEADDLARAWLLLDQAVRHFMPFPLCRGSARSGCGYWSDRWCRASRLSRPRSGPIRSASW